MPTPPAESMSILRTMTFLSDPAPDPAHFDPNLPPGSQVHQPPLPDSQPVVFIQQSAPIIEAPDQRALPSEITERIAIDVGLLLLGAVAGAACFYALTRSFAEPQFYLIFACLGAGFPFGWRALRFFRPFSTLHTAWGSNLVLVLFIWLIPIFLFILKVYAALIVGLPALVFVVIRHIWRVALAR